MKIRDINQLWKTALAQIEIKIDAPAQFKTFFRDSRLLRIDGKTAVIGVSNPYTSEWLKIKYEEMIREVVSYIYGDPLTITFEIFKKEESEPESQESLQETSPLLATENGIMGNVLEIIAASGLNPKYSMSNYIVGQSNRIAHAAALAIINKPGEAYNPLFIHGKTGVGKTHLAHAIGRGISERNIRKKIVYTPSEGFLNDLVRAIKTGQQEKLRAKYRPVDILIIDDMQLISKWVSTQEELFNTFNELHTAGKQIILIADRKPEEIKNIESRLRSRMQGGMVVDINQPDYETRLAILQKKAESSNFNISSLILEFVARSINDNVRALEGALQKISLFNQLKPEGDLSLEEVAHLLGIDAKSRRENVKVPSILKEVAKAFDVTVKELKGPRRTQEVALARQVAMFILREEYNYKLEEIANFLNKQDHTTVIHAIDKIKSKMMIQDGFNAQVVGIINKIQEGSAIEEEYE